MALHLAQHFSDSVFMGGCLPAWLAVCLVDWLLWCFLHCLFRGHLFFQLPKLLGASERQQLDQKRELRKLFTKGPKGELLKRRTCFGGVWGGLASLGDLLEPKVPIGTTRRSPVSWRSMALCQRRRGASVWGEPRKRLISIASGAWWAGKNI